MSTYPDNKEKKPFSLKETIRNHILRDRGGIKNTENKNGIESFSGTKPINLDSDK